jgi:hypothetical protein
MAEDVTFGWSMTASIDGRNERMNELCVVQP